MNQPVFAFAVYGMEADFPPHYSMFLLFLPLVIRLAWDYYTITIQKKEIRHSYRTWITGVLMIVVSFPVWKYGPVRYLILSVAASWGIFQFFFDYGLNKLRGEKLFYVDQELDGIGSKEDKFYQKLPWWGVLFIKFWFLFVFLCFYFYWDVITGHREWWMPA